jgi:hypothetical protein
VAITASIIATPPVKMPRESIQVCGFKPLAIAGGIQIAECPT